MLFTKYAFRAAACTLSLLIAQCGQGAGAVELPSAVAPAATREASAPAYAGEAISLNKPELKALVTIRADLGPYGLECGSSRTITLPDALRVTVDRNLDITLSALNKSVSKCKYLGSLGAFLPDVSAGYTYQHLNGRLNIPLGGQTGATKMDTPFIITSAGFRYYGYRGGAVLFTALQNRNLYRAAGHTERATISDALLETTRRYYDLLLNEMLLQIRIRAVEVSEAQVRLSQGMIDAGQATSLELYQSQTQLSQDRQRLIEQQIARRNAAIRLADWLNLDQSADLIPVETVVSKVRLLDVSTSAGAALSSALRNRPELKQIEEERLAARKATVIAAAPLQPSFSFAGNVYGMGETLSDSSRTVYRTSTSAGGGTVVPVSVSRQIAPLWSLSCGVNWQLPSLGTKDVAGVRAAALVSREALVRQSKERNAVESEVRQSYLTSCGVERQLDEATAQVRSATEELRLSRLRFKNGLAKNIDVLRAQQDYTQALVEKARAIVRFNVSQARLLRDMGVISIGSLTASAPCKPAS